MPVCIEPLPGVAFLAFPDMKQLLTAELRERFAYNAAHDGVYGANVAAHAHSSADAARRDSSIHAIATEPRWYGDLLYCPDWQLNSSAGAYNANTAASASNSTSPLGTAAIADGAENATATAQACNASAGATTHNADTATSASNSTLPLGSAGASSLTAAQASAALPAVTPDGAFHAAAVARPTPPPFAEPALSPTAAAQAAQAFPYWARTGMLRPQLIRFDSIGEAAQALRTMQRSWAPYQYQLFRRAALVQEKLPHVNLKPRTFPLELPSSPIGLYTLLDANTMLASAATTSVLPAGALQFVEDHENPPSRAYLKLQEALTLARHYFGVELPTAGTRCFEAGACPGGWTWVLRSLGADVLAVDRAPLSPALMADSHVEFRAHDAFTLAPSELGTFDWVFSDVICYPERLYDWIQRWLSSGRTRNMICTIKMQGAIDWRLVARFAAIPHSRVVHLNYNKHELTWLHAEP